MDSNVNYLIFTVRLLLLIHTLKLLVDTRLSDHSCIKSQLNWKYDGTMAQRAIGFWTAVFSHDWFTCLFSSVLPVFACPHPLPSIWLTIIITYSYRDKYTILKLPPRLFNCLWKSHYSLSSGILGKSFQIKFHLIIYTLHDKHTNVNMRHAWSFLISTNPIMLGRQIQVYLLTFDM